MTPTALMSVKPTMIALPYLGYSLTEYPSGISKINPVGTKARWPCCKANSSQTIFSFVESLGLYMDISVSFAQEHATSKQADPCVANLKEGASGWLLK